ncbi:MAG: aldo/keto reductase [Synergistaceae bacterium]|jgi:predicted aldo/keto reductase-like oxidoreductase|nr:aldo/keto reductase [Synergistaceae bacterium]
MYLRHEPKLNMPLSPLGFGVMRLPVNADGTFPAEVHALLAEAYVRGINYFDTAYTYLGGHSEELVRDALVRRFPRDAFCIADKLPVWECANRDDMERIFGIQFERLGVDHIDFYLLHGLYRQRWLDIYNKGALDFLEDKRREGKIRKVGFSMHDTTDTLKLIESAYNWDFAQLQINYYDWTAQRAKESYEYLAERGIPCMVMEPVGGGRLAKLPREAETLLNGKCPDETAVSLALRFAASLPNVAVTLSGMATREQLDENMLIFEHDTPLSDAEMEAIDGIVKIIRSKNPVPCSACRYCVEDCPKGVDIPQIFQRYNDCKLFENSDRFDNQYFVFVPEGRRADSCISCGKCVKQCPQKINIPTELKAIHKEAAGLLLGVDIDGLKDATAAGGRLVCFGAGAVGRNTLKILRTSGVAVSYFCDNSEKLWGTEIDGITVINPAQLAETNRSEKLLVLVTSGNHAEKIKRELTEIGIQPLIGN